jgi:hypothetical protein
MSELFGIIRKTLMQTAKDGNLFMSILTLVSSLLIIIVFLFNDNLRAPNYYFLLAIAISELLGSVSIITNFGLGEDQKLISFILNLIEIFSDFFVTLFITFIAYCIYILIVKSERDSNKKIKLFIIVGTIVSILYTIILAMVHITTEDTTEDSYSKIKLGYYSDNYNQSILIHYIIILIMTAINIFFFIRTIIFLNAKNKQDKKNGYKLMKTRNLLINYPLIGTSWIVLSLISFIIQKIISTNNDIGKLRLIYIFIFIANLFTYLRGAFIFIIFIKSKKVTTIFYSIGACLYRCLKKINMNQMPSS